MKDNKKYPENYFTSFGILLGVILGIPLAISLKNFAFIGIGIPIGLAIGLAIEEEHKKHGRIRPLTKEEKKSRKIALIIGVGVLLLGIISFLLLLRI